MRSTKDIFNIIPWLHNLAKAFHVNFTSRVGSSLGYWMVQTLHNKCNNIKIGARLKTIMKINILKTNLVYSLDLFLAPEFSSFTFFRCQHGLLSLSFRMLCLLFLDYLCVHCVIRNIAHTRRTDIESHRWDHMKNLSWKVTSNRYI